MLRQRHAKRLHLRLFHLQLTRSSPQTAAAASDADDDSNAVPNAPSLTLHFLKSSCGLSADAALAVTKRIRLKNTRNSHSVLALLKDFGFSQTHIARLVAHRPNLLLSNPSTTLQPKLDFYRRIGLSDSDLPEILSKRPQLFLFSLKDRLEPNVEVLRSILGDEAGVLQAIRGSPSLLASDLHGVLLPRIEKLKRYGVSESVILTLLKYKPVALIESPLRFEECFNAIKNMGISPSKTIFSHAFSVLSRLPKPKWERKLDNFRSLGWSEEQVIRAFTKHPYCMSVSEEKIKQKMEFFSYKLKWTPDYISYNPVVLSLSLERRILPRCLVFRMLESKGLRIRPVRAGHIMLGNKKFLKKFVIKYQNEVPELLGAIEGNKLELKDVPI